MKKNILLGFILTALLTGCAQYPSLQNQNPVPKYKDISFLDYKKASRAPAAFQNKTTALVKSSNKTVYFLGLYDQFHKLKKLTGSNESQILSCPRFHNVYLDYNETHNISMKENKSFWDKTLIQRIIKRNLQKISFPELSLPRSTNEKKAISDISSLKEEDIKVALNNHIENTKKEITKICTTGISENYFIFENLITYLENNPGFKKNKKAFDTLMKTTVFSNILLIKSLEEEKKNDRSIASGFNYIEEEVLLRLNASWAKPLINDIKMVKRGK